MDTDTENITTVKDTNDGDAKQDQGADNMHANPDHSAPPLPPVRLRPPLRENTFCHLTTPGYKLRGHLYKSQLSMSLPDLSSYIQRQKGLPLRYEQFSSPINAPGSFSEPETRIKLPVLNIQGLSPPNANPKLMNWGQQSPRTKQTVNPFLAKMLREKTIVERPHRLKNLPEADLDNHHLLFGSVHDDRFEDRDLWRPRFKPDCSCTRCESHRVEWQKRRLRFENNEPLTVEKPAYLMLGVYAQGGNIT